MKYTNAYNREVMTLNLDFQCLFGTVNRNEITLHAGLVNYVDRCFKLIKLKACKFEVMCPNPCDKVSSVHVDVLCVSKDRNNSMN